MKAKLPVVAWFGLIPWLILALCSCNRNHPETPAPPRETTYDVKGVVREIDAKDQQLVIEHETIPGYMDAMTMPFRVKDTNLLAEVAVDDTVKFQLIVTDTDAWIATMARVGVANPPPAATNEPSDVAINDVPLVHGGDVVPDFTLTDQDGKTIRLGDFRGKPVVLTFFFTRCPLPTFCPLMMRNFQVLQTELKQEYGDQFHLLGISFDPEHDTPAVLKEYAGNFTTDFKTWSYATGAPAEVERIASLFGLSYKSEDGSITHTLRTALIDSHGRLVHIWKSNVWQPQEVLTMVQEIAPKK